MDHETVIFGSVEDVSDPPAAGHLVVSGCSVVFYQAHRFASPDSLSAAFREQRLSIPDDERSYASRVRPGSGFEYSSFIDAGPVPASLAEALSASGTTRLRQSVLWLGEEYAVSAIPFVISASQQGDANIRVPVPVGVDQLLRFLAVLTQPSTAQALGEAVAARAR